MTLVVAYNVDAVRSHSAEAISAHSFEVPARSTRFHTLLIIFWRSQEYNGGQVLGLRRSCYRTVGSFGDELGCKGRNGPRGSVCLDSHFILQPLPAVRVFSPHGFDVAPISYLHRGDSVKRAEYNIVLVTSNLIATSSMDDNPFRRRVTCLCRR